MEEIMVNPNEDTEKNNMLDLPELFELFASDEKEQIPEESGESEEYENDCSFLSVSAATNVGLVRRHNEDNFFLSDGRMREEENESLVLQLQGRRNYQFAVCDGMGGEAFGQEAAILSVEALADHQQQLADSMSLDELLHNVNAYASDANNRICDMMESRQSGRSGSTMTLIHIERRTVYPFSIGDSRIYHYDGSRLVQISEDHTLAMKKVKANIYTEEEARASLDSHKLTYFLGIDLNRVGMAAMKYEPLMLDETSAILMCSDGLTDMCTDEEICEIIGNDCENTAQALVDRALANGGVDNVTCVVVRFHPGERMPEHESE